MFTIHLNNLRFYSHHGVHEEEMVLGNEFVVNVSIEIDPGEKVTAMDQTVNYASVYRVIEERMKIPTVFLETLTQELAQLIAETNVHIRSINVAVEKKHPPLVGIEGSVAVTYNKKY